MTDETTPETGPEPTPPEPTPPEAPPEPVPAPVDTTLDAIKAFIASDAYVAFEAAFSAMKAENEADIRFKAHIDCIDIGMTNLALVTTAVV